MPLIVIIPLASAAATALLMLPATAPYAHDGVTDAVGCHSPHLSARYHCHRGPLAGQEFPSQRDALENLTDPKSGFIAGQASPLDGDTVRVSGRTVRLFGVDAPELEQKCRSKGGVPWHCGYAALVFTELELLDNQIICTIERTAMGDAARDGEEILAGICYPVERRTPLQFRPGSSLNAELVDRGYAVADRNQTSMFAEFEDVARTLGSGIWRGSFEMPWEWRKEHAGE